MKAKAKLTVKMTDDLGNKKSAEALGEVEAVATGDPPLASRWANEERVSRPDQRSSVDGQ